MVIGLDLSSADHPDRFQVDRMVVYQLTLAW